MKLTNTRGGQLVLPSPPEGQGHSVEVARLSPGVNEVPADYWQHCQKHPQVQLWLELGYLKPGSAEPQQSEQSAAEPEPAPEPEAPEDKDEEHPEIQHMKVRDAKAYIDLVDDHEWLMAMRERDNRQGVKDACTRRLEELGAEPDEEFREG